MREMDTDEKLWLAGDDAIRQGRRLEVISQILLFLVLLSAVALAILTVSDDSVDGTERVLLLVWCVVGALVNVGLWQAVSLFGVRGRLDGLRAQAEILTRDITDEKG